MKNRKPLLRVVDSASATLIGPDQAPTADLLPDLDWTPRHTWRTSHTEDGSIVIRQADQTITLRPHEAPAFLASIYRSAFAFEGTRRKLSGGRS